MHLNICYAGHSWLLEGDYTRAEKETGPTYECGGTPAVPADFCINTAYLEGTDANGLPCVINVTNLIEDGFAVTFLRGLEAACLERIEELGL